MSQNAAHVIRDMNARAAAIRQYAAAHDHFAELAQMNVLLSPKESADFDKLAGRLMRAVRAELDDPPITPMSLGS